MPLLSPSLIRAAALFCAALVLSACSGGESGPPPQPPVPVRAVNATVRDVPVYITALGTVTPESTALVKSRVDGRLLSLHFVEGQDVKQGDLLAVIDPRPFEVALMQAEGALAKDSALLKNAKQDLARFRRLVKEGSVSTQQLQAQEAAAGQYEGQVASDKAAVADAALQLEYSRVTAPFDGRAGLKQVDVGNMIRASDSAGIVVITRTKPMTVVFSVVEKDIPEVLRNMKGGAPLPVSVFDQTGALLSDKGVLQTLDNRIDTATGTVKAKALFANEDDSLFPNQFVNVRLTASVQKGVLTVPAAAVQRGEHGFFVYIAREGKAVYRPIKTGYTTAELAVVLEGPAAGDAVVTQGVDRLRDGTPLRQ